MSFQIFGIRFYFSFWFFALASLFLLLDREVLAVYFALPILVHEAGHLVVMLLCGVNIRSVSFQAHGVGIQRREPRFAGLGGELAIHLAGIAANLLFAAYLYLFRFQSMRTMLLVGVNIAVALFNLLPIGNLDGGEAAKLLAGHFFRPELARTLSRLVSFLVLVPLFALSIFLLLIRSHNVTLLVTCVYLAVIVIFRE